MINIVEIAKILCAEKIIISGEKEIVKGCPRDLAKKYGLNKFISALQKYVPEGKVQVKWHKQGNNYEIFKI